MACPSLRSVAVVTLFAFVVAFVGRPRGAAAEPQQQEPGEAPRPSPAPAYPASPQPLYPAPAQPVYPPGYAPYPPAQPRMRLVEKPRLGLIVAGSCILGGSYLMTALSGYIAGRSEYVVPVVGPLLAWQKENGANDGSARLVNAGLIMLTLVQTSGLVMIIVGAATRKKVMVLGTEVSLAPTLLPGGGGVAAMARF